MFVFIIYLIFSPTLGKIKLGGPDAEPELNYWNWFAIALCAGIAIGIVFWGVAEPLMHFHQPPEIAGVEGASPGAAIEALSISFLHWSLHPYALYAVIGLTVAFATYNLKLPFKISSVFYPLIGDKIHSFTGNLIDAIALFAIVGGVVTSLGLGTLQIAGGLDYIWGFPGGNLSYILIIIGVTFIYTMSSYTGLQRGIRFFSDNNAKLFFGLTIFLFIMGPSVFLLDLSIESIGQYIANIIPMSFWTDSFETSGGWGGGWTIFYWAWWIAFAPIVGMFLARISYGRTIREFLVVNVIAPASFGIIWFTVFGGNAIYLDKYMGAGLIEQIGSYGEEISMYALLENFPLAGITLPIAVLMVAISFVTLADSMTSTMALMTAKNYSPDEESEAPAPLKIFWGVLMGALTLLFLIIGGAEVVEALQTASLVSALPIFVLQLLAIVAFLKVLYWGDYDFREDIPPK